MNEQQIILTLATKIMGWKRYGETEFWHGENGNLFDPSLWNPLQNIADAWMIIEKLKDNFDSVYVGHTSDGWYCQFQSMLPPKEFGALFSTEDYDGEGKTAQEAICKAALEAVA